MDVKRMHCMIEKLSECAKEEFEKGIECVDTDEMGKVTDMLKDLAEAMYYRTLTNRWKSLAQKKYFPCSTDTVTDVFMTITDTLTVDLHQRAEEHAEATQNRLITSRHPICITNGIARVMRSVAEI